jgi:predicted transcriptional regulator YheO
MTLSNYIPICDAMVFLMHPLVEIVIHDIISDKIIYMNGGLSHRRVGDQSLMDKEGLRDIDKIVYPKINFDGRLVKSISVALDGKWLLCINYDVSLFSQMQGLSQIMLNRDNASQPKALFTNDWQEKLNMTVHTYLKNHNLSFDLLNSKNKKLLLEHLFALGAFSEKNAADYIAKILKMGRATVFKYLKEWRK